MRQFKLRLLLFVERGKRKRGWRRLPFIHVVQSMARQLMEKGEAPGLYLARKGEGGSGEFCGYFPISRNKFTVGMIFFWAFSAFGEAVTERHPGFLRLA